MSNRRFIVDPRKLKQTRGSMTQEELSKRSGVSTPRIKQLESLKGNSHSARWDTISSIANALNCQVESLLSNTLADYRDVPELQGQRHLEHQLKSAINLDMNGDSKSAANAGIEVLNSLRTETGFNRYASVLDRVMTFLDHANRQNDAIAMANEVLAGLLPDETSSSVLWVKYQLAICLKRQAGKSKSLSKKLSLLNEAEMWLNELLSSAQHETAATQQLGEVCLIRSKDDSQSDELKKAERFFNKCRKAWSQAGDHREGFALVSLAEVYSEQGNPKKAIETATQALEIFAWNHCKRDVDSTRMLIGKLVQCFDV